MPPVFLSGLRVTPARLRYARAMRQWAGAGLALCMLACGDGGPDAALSVPDPGTSHVVYGTASAGRALRPGALVVAPAAGLETVTPEVIGGSGVDMLFAGVDPADLPKQLDVLDLRFAAETDVGARRMITLHAPYVLRGPSDPEAPEPLVPVDEGGLSRDVREERTARLAQLLAGLGVEDPCVELPTPLTVTTPRTSAEFIGAMQVLGGGDVAMGFSMTSTVMVGVLPATGGEVRPVPLPTEAPILLQGESAEARWLSSDGIEVEGRQLPRALTFDVSSGFGTTAVAYTWSEASRRYVQTTPFTADSSPRTLRGIVAVPLDGEPSVCAFGGEQGADRTATIWCRTETSTTWRVSLSLPRSGAVTTVVPRADERHVAVDVTGSVYQYGGQDRWSVVLESAVNSGCDPICAAFTTTLPAPGVASLVTVAAGAQAQLLLVEEDGGLTARRPAALNDALFADERPGAEDPLRISAVSQAADGTLFIADAHPTLLRLAPDGSRVDRICLPRDMRDVPIASLLAHPDGRLLVGMSPALLATGAWR